MKRIYPRQVLGMVGLLVLLGLGANVSPVEGQGATPRPAHVVIVVEENHAYSDIIGNPAAPYINSLARRGAAFTQSFGVTHPSQPNYLALFSGSTQGVVDDACTYTFSAPNLGHDLIAAGSSFTGYSEDLPSVGFTGCTSGQYVRKHNPWVNWQSDISPSANELPTAVNQPFTSFPSDFTALPTLSIVVPNQGHDMHDGTIAQADAWLQQFIEPYVQWAKTHDSLLIITWDEDDSTHANQIPTIFVGPMVSPALYDEPITHYNVLRTIEDMYGLSPIGEAATADPIADVWIDPSLAAPTDLKARGISKTSIRLRWADNSAGETGFKILQSSDGVGFTAIATVGAGVTTFTDAGLPAGSTFQYKVRAFGANGNSPDSNIASGKTRGRH